MTYKSEFQVVLDALVDHRMSAHGFRDLAEYAVSGCETCERLNAELDRIDRELKPRRGKCQNQES